MSGSSNSFVSKLQIWRKIVICDKSQNEVMILISYFRLFNVLPATIRKPHNQAIMQAVPAVINKKIIK